MTGGPPVTRPDDVEYRAACDAALDPVRAVMGAHRLSEPVDADLRGRLRAAAQDAYKVCEYTEYTLFQRAELRPWAAQLPGR